VVHLRKLGVGWSDIEEVTEVLAPFALAWAMRISSPLERRFIAERFEALRSVEEATSEAFRATYLQVLAKIASGASPTLSFMFSLMAGLMPLCENEEPEDEAALGLVPAALEPLQQAIIDGDVALARRRMIALPKIGPRFGASSGGTPCRTQPQSPRP
jgi:hypothetical protein